MISQEMYMIENLAREGRIAPHNQRGPVCLSCWPIFIVEICWTALPSREIKLRHSEWISL